MAVFGLFKKKEPEDYEEVLQSIQVDIQKRQQRLQDIKLRERRTTLLITLYTFGAWVASIGAWYAGWRPAGSAPLIIGPIIIQFARRISQWWYTRRGDAEEATLKSLLAKQKNKVEEIKKKTNYYSMKNLVERYDGPHVSTPGRPRGQAPQGQQPQPQQQTPQRPQQGPPSGAPQTPVHNRGQPNSQVPQQPPATPYQRQWYDRLIDAILGEEESANSPKSQYALICQKCYTHNGLVKEEQWQDTQFICMKCGDFNPSVRAIQSGQGMMSPPKVIAPLSQPTSAVSQQRRSAPRKSALLSDTTSFLLDADESNLSHRKSGLAGLEESDHEDADKRRRPKDAIDALLASDDEDMSVVSSPTRPRPREVQMEVDSSHHLQKKNKRARFSDGDEGGALALSHVGSGSVQQQVLAAALAKSSSEGRAPKLYAVMEF